MISATQYWPGDVLAPDEAAEPRDGRSATRHMPCDSAGAVATQNIYALADADTFTGVADRINHSSTHSLSRRISRFPPMRAALNLPSRMLL
jgi:hypothetical protein